VLTVTTSLKPWLWLPPRVAHDLSPFVLKACSLVRSRVTYEWRPLEWKGLRFANRLGIAGGVDKNGGSVPGWWTLGPGFLEIGTVTPLPQGPNPGQIMQRDIREGALWNRMGFPSAGADRVARNLAKLGRPYHSPLLVNIGKNRATPNECAADDYITCMRKLAAYADAFVINISSPNTSGLRDLLKRENLKNFLAPLSESRNALPTRTPLLLKLSPDIGRADLDSALATSIELGLDGWIVSNTTLQREPGSRFPAEGGVSGAPLANLSRDLLKTAVQLLGPDKHDRLLISAGGIMSPSDVRERLELGADLVQVYSALIFQGPGFFAQVAREFANEFMNEARS
jgi:dihydroorotate dehydrogenase